MWADGVLTGAQLRSAMQAHCVPLLSGIPGGLRAVGLLLEFADVAAGQVAA
jgi:hypothetical protein